MGRGKDAKACADDPIIRSTPGYVYRLASKLGLSFVAARHGEECISLAPSDIAKLDRQAAVKGLQRRAYIEYLISDVLRKGYGAMVQ